MKELLEVHDKPLSKYLLICYCFNFLGQPYLIHLHILKCGISINYGKVSCSRLACSLQTKIKLDKIYNATVFRNWIIDSAKNVILERWKTCKVKLLISLTLWEIFLIMRQQTGI
jgi:hypothetical protein